MTFFQRIKTPFTEAPADEEVRYQPRMRLVGELLQERREHLGLDLDEIGAMLRIKPAYLGALEQGRSADLPGPTYAIGFVRAYADFLGLDSEAVLARFKSEAAGVTARPDLALPVPLGERSLPGGALVLVALILALCGYGIWYYLSTEERDRPARVAALPASLQPPGSGPVLVPPPRPSEIAAASGADQKLPSVPPSPAPAPQSPLFGAAINPAPPAQTVSPQRPPTAQQQAAATPAAPSASAAPAAPAAPPQQTTLSAATPSPAASGAAPRPGTPPPAQPAPAALPATAQTAGAVPAGPGVAPPSSNARIAIRALSDCWIQIRAQDQSIVFSRVLKSGEVYTVPRPGLSLRTGNAGALELTVDGRAVPSIGGIGALRKDVALDPAELAAGTAVHG